MELTKANILQKVSQVEIFEYYLEAEVDLNMAYYSITREENEPSCRFYFKDGTLRFNDYGDVRFNVDCFDFIGRLYNLDTRNPRDFVQVLRQIATDFNLIKVNPIGLRKNIITKKPKNYKVIKSKVDYNLAEMSDFDLRWWRKLNVSAALLKECRYYRLLSVFINGNRTYSFDVLRPAYIGLEGILNDEVIYQMYFPFKDKSERYRHNKNVTRLIDLLQPCAFVLITKSRKDAIVAKSFGIQTIALGSETNYLTEKEINFIKEKTKCKQVFSLFDYDKTGKLAAVYHRRHYKVIPLFLKEPEIVNFSGKDLSDFVTEKGIDKTRALIEEYKHAIKQKYDK